VMGSSTIMIGVGEDEDEGGALLAALLSSMSDSLSSMSTTK